MLSLQAISPAFDKNLKRTTFSLCNLYLKNNPTHLYYLKKRKKEERERATRDRLKLNGI